ncbi:MAG: phosphodiester glycosidase family protein [Pseudomonadota bacterium]
MWRVLALFLLLPVSAAAASDCRDMEFDGLPYTVCEVAAGQDLRLFQSGPDGVLGSFSAVNDLLAAEGKTLGFAMNAGMYRPDRRPVGLYVEDGVAQTPLVTRDGPGNFGLLPNGVFCVGDGFRVIESVAFKAEAPACRYASQSGPMLVIKGKLHPKFLADSDSTYIRNGVGVSADGQRAVFAISNRAVNFHSFARLFRDGLGLPDALYFDGSISRLYAPEMGRSDLGFFMGPMVGTVVPKG